jgi:hypothetical protein
LERYITDFNPYHYPGKMSGAKNSQHQTDDVHPLALRAEWCKYRARVASARYFPSTGGYTFFQRLICPLMEYDGEVPTFRLLTAVNHAAFFSIDKARYYFPELDMSSLPPVTNKYLHAANVCQSIIHFYKSCGDRRFKDVDLSDIDAAVDQYMQLSLLRQGVKIHRKEYATTDDWIEAMMKYWFNVQLVIHMPTFFLYVMLYYTMGIFVEYANEEEIGLPKIAHLPTGMKLKLDGLTSRNLDCPRPLASFVQAHGDIDIMYTSEPDLHGWETFIDGSSGALRMLAFKKNSVVYMPDHHFRDNKTVRGTISTPLCEVTSRALDIIRRYLTAFHYHDKREGEMVEFGELILVPGTFILRPNTYMTPKSHVFNRIIGLAYFIEREHALPEVFIRRLSQYRFTNSTLYKKLISIFVHTSFHPAVDCALLSLA